MKPFLSFLVPLTASLLAITTASPAQQTQTAPSQNGRLVIIGGGTITDGIMERIVRDAGGAKQARVLIVPYAKTDAAYLAENAKRFTDYGCASIDSINCPPAEIDQPENLAKLDGINVVFFSGGVQRDLARALLGTRFLERVKERHKTGATIAGTSAGAAVMSKVMIGGGHRKIPKGKKADTYGVIAKDDVNLEEGFGFMPGVIIHQHFVARKRLDSLFSALLDRPDMPGVGIDESTAIDVAPDGSFEVVGDSSVMVFEPGFKQGEQPRFDVRILRKGDRYSPGQKPPPPDTQPPQAATSRRQSPPAGQSGRLIVIGGALSTSDIKERVVRYAGGAKKARVLIVPYASKIAARKASLDKTTKLFTELGCASVDFINCPPAEIDRPENLAKLDEINVVFFSGGYQQYLAKALLGTRFLERIKKLHEAGATIAGSSAGAAVMSKNMIGGGSQKEGFGFMPGVMIHQHFVVRKRVASLFSIMSRNPDMLGVGIDEDTAIDVAPDGSFEVLGASSVMVLEPKFKQGEKPRFDVRLLWKGDRHTPAKNHPIRPASKS